MILHDQHIHSYYSVDSSQSLEGYLELARQRGVSYFITTEHLDLDYIFDGNNWTFNIQKRNEELDALQKKYPEIKMLKGIEIGYRKATLERTYKVLKENSFDLVNLSVHECNRLDLYHPQAFNKYGIENVLTQYFDSILEAVENYPDYDILCHIDYGFKTAYMLDNNQKISKFEEQLIKILKALIQKDKALEINTKVEEYINDEHTTYLLKLYKGLGGENLTLSSDAHEDKRYCDKFDHYLELIKKAGFDHLCYFVNRERKIYKI